MKKFYRKLVALQGKNYGAYKDLLRWSWKMGDFDFSWIHIQGDPHARPSRLRLEVRLENLGLDKSYWNSTEKALAAADFLLRRLLPIFAQESIDNVQQEGFVNIAPCGPEILRRNYCRIDNDKLVLLLAVALPGDGRKILAQAANILLLQKIPDLLTEALYSINYDLADLQEHIDCLLRQRALRDLLEERNWVAFVAEGAILPRLRSLSGEVLLQAEPFVCPPDQKVEVEVAGSKIVGMPVSAGLTIIAGGAYHGKSTLLEALENGVYDHIPGDGRELVVSLACGVKVQTEPGRRVNGIDISALVRNLPGAVDTADFHSANASGSTSQVANLMEALASDAKLIFIDEDSSAVNFLMRDGRMQLLVNAENEPLIPLWHRLDDFKELGVSLVMVIGACGDYLQVADQVLVMQSWQPRNATGQAQKIVAEHPVAQVAERHPPFVVPQSLQLEALQKAYAHQLRPNSSVERHIKIHLRHHIAQLGRIRVDVGRIPQWTDPEQIRGAIFLALRLLQNDRQEPIADILRDWYGQVWQSGFKFSRADHYDLALPRVQEVLSLINRF
mgnify:CR=1 FL=1